MLYTIRVAFTYMHKMHYITYLGVFYLYEKNEYINITEIKSIYFTNTWTKSLFYSKSRKKGWRKRA